MRREIVRQIGEGIEAHIITEADGRVHVKVNDASGRWLKNLDKPCTDMDAAKRYVRDLYNLINE